MCVCVFKRIYLCSVLTGELQEYSVGLQLDSAVSDDKRRDVCSQGD